MIGNDQSSGLSVLQNDIGVSDEVIERLKIFKTLLIKWQKAQNLVSRETIDAFWLRHVCDSARLLLIVREPAKWLDFGSGAGFPGLVTAILQSESLSESLTGHVYLVESNTRKVSFLRSVIRETGISAEVHNGRIEDVVKYHDFTVPYISARALASLNDLLMFSKPLTDKGARCFFHKGRDIDSEIDNASNNWDFDLIKHTAWISEKVPSDGIILEVSHINRKVD